VSIFKHSQITNSNLCSLFTCQCLCCSRYVAHPSHMHTKLLYHKTCKCLNNKAAAQIGTNVRARGLLPDCWLQFASGRSCDRPSRSRFSVVFLGPRANVELVPKFHVALHAFHAALPTVTLKFSRPNVAPLMSV
jgi:hypothetical protein